MIINPTNNYYNFSRKFKGKKKKIPTNKSNSFDKILESEIELLNKYPATDRFIIFKIFYDK